MDCHVLKLRSWILTKATKTKQELCQTDAIIVLCCSTSASGIHTEVGRVISLWSWSHQAWKGSPHSNRFSSAHLWSWRQHDDATNQLYAIIIASSSLSSLWRTRRIECYLKKILDRLFQKKFAGKTELLQPQDTWKATVLWVVQHLTHQGISVKEKKLEAVRKCRCPQGHKRP